jgi:hypothetical protein
MHLDDERIERLVAGELDRRDSAEARHLAECADCRARLAQATREDEGLRELLGALDHAPPVVDAFALIARERGRGRAGRRWAAGILLALGVAGGAYAASAPLGRLVERMRDRGSDTLEAAPAAAPERAAPAAAEPTGGVAVDASAPLVVVFESAAPGARARISLGDDSRLVVEAFGGAPGFAESAGRLVITAGPATPRFEVRIPRAAPSVELRVGEQRLFLKEGSNIAVAPAGGAGGPWLLELASGP